jgi:hypothetical protein
MTYRPPLSVYLLFHPESEKARQLAESLVPDLMAGPASRGLRVPVFLTPDRGDGLPPSLDENDPNQLNLDAAQHTVVVVLADAQMQKRIMGGTGKEWADFLLTLLKDHDRSRHQILLVSLDDKGTDLDDELAGLNYIVLDQNEDLESHKARVAFHLGVRSLLLMRDIEIPSDGELAKMKAPVNLFLSHAKADLDKEKKGPVHRVLEESTELPIEHWYDAQNIDPAVEFTEPIRKGIRDADLVIVFQTDSWAKSEWCRMEAIYAKRVGTPILVVDALNDGEPCRFSYGGNSRSLRWRVPRLDQHTDALTSEKEKASQQLRKLEANRLISAAIQEILYRRHTLRLMKGQAEENDVSLDTAPEAAHLGFYPDTNSFLYPDPPLSKDELELLQDVRPTATFETPLMRAAAHLNLVEQLTVAVSVSDSEVLSRYGLTDLHYRTLIDEIHLYLLVAGLRIAYGGKLDPDKLEDPDNFTVRLFNLVSRYRTLAKNLGTKLAPILNVAPWPLWKLYDDDVQKLFGRIAELDTVPCPELGFPESDLESLPNGFVIPNTALNQYAWGPAMTAMRIKMTLESFARVSIGGKIEGYKGRYAGLIEEPLLSLREEKPLFLVGALGGCTRLVIDLLEQRPRTEMTTQVAQQNVENYDEVAALYAKYGQELKTREELAVEIQAFGTDGPAKALKNGLTDEQNRELFACTEARRIAELILTGISELTQKQV